MDKLRNESYIKELRKDFNTLLWEIYNYKYETLDDDMPDRYDQVIDSRDYLIERINELIEE